LKRSTIIRILQIFSSISCTVQDICGKYSRKSHSDLELGNSSQYYIYT